MMMMMSNALGGLRRTADRHLRTRRQRNIGNNGACITQDRRVIIFVVVVAIWLIILIIRVVAIRKFRRRRGGRALLAGALPQGVLAQREYRHRSWPSSLVVNASTRHLVVMGSIPIWVTTASCC